MTKKGYQKRLPSELPTAAPAPTVPAPRPAPEENESLRPAAPAGPHAAVVPAVERPFRELGSAPFPQESAPAVGRVRGFAAGRHHTKAVKAFVGVVMILTMLAVVGLLMFFLAQDSDAPPTERAPESADATPAPLRLTADESYIETRVRANGDVVVHQWIRAAEPFAWISLALPEVPGATDLTAAEVRVVADGAGVAGPDEITGSTTTYIFPRTSDVEVRYVVRGAVTRSASTPGRALAVATSLDVRFAPLTERETRVVHAPAVLSLACSSSPQASTVPCGEAVSADQWRVELTGPHVADRVVAQLTLD